MLAAFGQELVSTQEPNHESPALPCDRGGRAAPAISELFRMRSLGLPENCYEMPSSTHTHIGSKRKSGTTIICCVCVCATMGRALTHRVLQKGQRAGHWGLHGVRERAQRIGAQLDIWSEAKMGTEIQLRVPAAVAYDTSRRRRSLRLFRVGRTHEPHP